VTCVGAKALPVPFYTSTQVYYQLVKKREIWMQNPYNHVFTWLKYLNQGTPTGFMA